MAYSAFYNKYRPQTFDEVVGQNAVVTTLKNAIKTDKIAHAYLFCGPRGTGKTTMARLFAKALDCSQGVGHQCNECESCEKISHGQHPDVIEIDAASNSTVDSVRQLIDSVSYQPIMSRYKIYIIDEVHNMSESAFNALLKTIEEPPKFVIFILATTDPQKILPTILSRVQRFDFSKVSDVELIKNMKRVLESEHISYEEEAIRLIASLSDGGVRDSLSLLDKVVSYCGDNVRLKDVNDLLGLLSIPEEINLINAISDKKNDMVLKSVKDHYNSGLDLRRLQNDLLKILKDHLIFSMTKDASLLEYLKPDEVQTIRLSTYDCQKDIRILMQNIRDNRLSDDHLTQFELALLSMTEEEKENPVSIGAIHKGVLPQISKKTEEKKGQVIESTTVEIKSSNEVSGYSAEAKKSEDSNDRIVYTSSDLLFLMEHYDKDERAAIRTSWSKIENEFLTKNAATARALSSCNPLLFGMNVLIVTSDFKNEIDRINTKEKQKELVDICEKAFGKPYNVLPLTKAEFNEVYSEFKAGRKSNKEELTIDFGKKNETNSTDFMNELLNGGE